jgi:hypothetical protein
MVGLACVPRRGSHVFFKVHIRTVVATPVRVWTAHIMYRPWRDMRSFGSAARSTNVSRRTP